MFIYKIFIKCMHYAILIKVIFEIDKLKFYFMIYTSEELELDIDIKKYSKFKNICHL